MMGDGYGEGSIAGIRAASVVALVTRHRARHVVEKQRRRMAVR